MNTTFDDLIAASRNEAGTLYIQKFGLNLDVDTTQEDVWDRGGIYVHTVAGGAEHFISSSDSGDTQDINIQGLGPTGVYQTKDVTLVGQTKTSIGNWLRVFRMKNGGATDFAGTVYCYEDDTVTAGVPQTAGNAKVRAQINYDAEKKYNQTNMALVTIPKNYTGFLMALHGAVGKGKDADILLYARSNGGVFRAQYYSQLFERPLEQTFPIPLRYSELTDLKISADSANTNTPVFAGFTLYLVKTDKLNK